MSAAAVIDVEAEAGPASRAPNIPGRDGVGWLARHPLLRCVAIYRQMPVRFGICLGLFVAVNGGMAVQQHLVGRAVDDLQRGRAVVRLATGGLDMRPALAWVAILLGVAAVRAVLQYAAGVLSLTIGQELLSRLREGILIQVQRLDLGYHLRHGVGEMVTRTTRDADKVRDALISVWRNVVETTPGRSPGPSASSPGTRRRWRSGPVVATALGLGWLVRQVDKLVVLDRTVGAAFDGVNQDLTEGVHGIRVIKAFGLEPSRIARFEAAVNTFVAAARRALRFASTHIPVPQVIVAFSQIWVLVLGARLVAHGRLDVGSLVASLLMMNTVVFRVEAIGRVMQTFADARSSAARMMELLDAEPSIKSGRAAVPRGALGVQLNAVTVRTPGGAGEVLSDCSLWIAPGEIVALVGATGSGKSTLSALLAAPGRRRRRPRVHRVRGARLDATFATWRCPTSGGNVHVVPQEVFLFSDTVRANLALGAPRRDGGRPLGGAAAGGGRRRGRPSCRKGWTRSSAIAASRCRAGSGSGWRWRARWRRDRRCWCWTTRPARWTR